MSTKNNYIFLYGKQYDITNFLHQHPGGSRILLRYQYKDATHVFEEVGHSKEAYALLEKLEMDKESHSKPEVREHIIHQPKKIPILENLLSVSIHTPHKSLMELSHKYKLYPVQLQFGIFKHEMLLFTHPSDVKHILSRDTIDFQKGRSYTSISSVTPQHVLVLEGDIWQKRRNMIIRLMELVKKHAIPVMYIHAKKLYKEMRKNVVNFSERSREYTLDVLCTILFGETMDISHKEDLHTLMNEWSYRTTELIPLWKSSYFPRTKRVKECLLRVYTFIRSKIGFAERKNSILNCLTDEIRIENITMEDAVWIVFSILAMGHENVSSLMTWMMYYLCKHSELQMKCREEVSEKLTFPIDQTQVLNELSLMDMVLKETLRLNPPIPIFTREPKGKNIDVNGNKLHAQEVVICPYATHRAKSVWGRDSEDFCPYRWKKNSNGFQDESATYIPFGYGERRCPGQTFGIFQTKYLFAMLLRFMKERMDIWYNEPEEQLFISLRLNKLHVYIR